MDKLNITFIGGGNMAKSLIGGLIANGLKTDRLTVAEPDRDKRQHLVNLFAINCEEDNRTAVKDADVVVLAVKPQIMQTVVNEIAPCLTDSQRLTVSIAAGIRIDSIMKWIGNPCPLVRVMPNTPALIQAGAAALFANEHTNADQKNTAEALMRSVGTAIWLDDENQMDSVTALSGSGPAYFFYIMEIMEKAGEELGLDKDHARLLTIETALGAAKMALLSEIDPENLRQQVTSPGGTTEKALDVLKEGNINTLIKKAMTAAKQRSGELSKEFGK